MFKLEASDREVLENPRKKIVDAGDVILFAEARGLKAAEFFLAAVIEHAMALKAEPLYLLSNAKCAAGIHLYEKLDFQHDAGIRAEYGARHARCDVAMRYLAP